MITKQDTSDMTDTWDVSFDRHSMGTLGTKSVQVPEIGTYVWYQDKSYEILATATYQEKVGEKVQFGTHCTLLEVDDEGDDLCKETIKVNASDLRLI